MKSDKEFLNWMYWRLVTVHGENRNFDYMIRMRDIVKNMKDDEQKEVK